MERSIGPKTETAARFVEGSGGLTAICSLESAIAALGGRTGTLVREVARV